MQPASLQDLKKELRNLDPQQVEELCLRLARFKKENKELLHYLLFEAHSESGFIENVKEEIDEGFTQLNRANLYFVKKGMRKILRNINKYNRYSGNKATAIELHIYFLQKIKKSGIPVHESVMLVNLYQGQIKKVNTLLKTLHEDLRYDYKVELDKLNLND
jgi:hypothetical protein